MSRRRNRNRGGAGVARPAIASDLHGQMAEILAKIDGPESKESPPKDSPPAMPDSEAKSAALSETEAMGDSGPEFRR